MHPVLAFLIGLFGGGALGYLYGAKVKAEVLEELGKLKDMVKGL